MFTSWLNPSERARAGDDAVRRRRCSSPRQSRLPRQTSCSFHAPRRAAAASTTRWRSWRSRSARPACRTSIRGPSCGTSAWSIPTTAGRSTTSRRRRCSPQLDADCARDGRRRSRRGLVDDAATIASSCSRRPRCCGSGKDEREHVRTTGDYQPLDVHGGAQRRSRVRVRPRRTRPPAVIVVVPRLVATLTPDADVTPLGERVWGDTRLVLPPG